jgi:hypothetical protein
MRLAFIVFDLICLCYRIFDVELLIDNPVLDEHRDRRCLVGLALLVIATPASTQYDYS